MKQISFSDMVTIAANSAEAELIKQTEKGLINDKSDQDEISDDQKSE